MTLIEMKNKNSKVLLEHIKRLYITRIFHLPNKGLNKKIHKKLH